MMLDFKGIYYDTRCLFQHADPYKPGEPLRAYLADGERLLPDESGLRQNLTWDVYFPTASIFFAPFVMLPWVPAHILWMILTAASLVFAGFLMWNIGANYSPLISGAMICFILANSEILFLLGNSAGIVVCLCVVAVWCFLRDRFIWAGVLCLAASLAIKPHDAGFVWLYFLLAGAPYRKRALQTLLVTAVLGLAAIVWVTPIAPHWMQELHSNLLANSSPGSLSDPRPANFDGRLPWTVIDLQTVFSVFRDNPRFYNLATYLVFGPLLLVWIIVTLRSRFSQARAWLALAGIAALSMLPVYHRPYDAKLLLLTVPACAMLWAEGG
ncbi:MAG: glycosyltransferase family 87 protein, partial [Terracidiphilus sp.]